MALVGALLRFTSRLRKLDQQTLGITVPKECVDMYELKPGDLLSVSAKVKRSADKSVR